MALNFYTNDVLLGAEAQQTAKTCSEVIEQQCCNHCDIVPTASITYSSSNSFYKFLHHTHGSRSSTLQVGSVSHLIQCTMWSFNSSFYRQTFQQITTTKVNTKKTGKWQQISDLV